MHWGAIEIHDIHFDPVSYQNIAYTALTISTIVVASAALYVAYRNNFGLEPKILPGTAVIQLLATPYLLVTSFEVWNSRQYPIVLRWVDITIPNARITTPPTAPPGEWTVSRDQLIWDKRTLGVEKVRLEKLSYREFVIDSYVDASINIDELPPRWPISVMLFDPLQRREITIKSFIKFDKEKSVIRPTPGKHTKPTQEEIDKWKADPT
jgi:hypothetical protein